VASLPILELAPGLTRRPFLPIVARPTPIERLPACGERVWVKRDDLASPLYGGNKIRRWEWLLADAIDRGKTELLTVGGLGSTQVTSLIVHGTQAGLRVTGVLFDQPDTPFVHEALSLDAARGGEILRAGGYGGTTLATLRELVRRRSRAAFVAPGASGPLANVAYVDAMLELGLQVARGEAPRPDRIVVACGSGGTAVGLALGAAILGWPTRITAVRITSFVVSNPATLGALAAGTKRLLVREGLREKIGPLALEMDHRFVGEGYGYGTPEAERGAQRYEALFGAPGEVTYSGKSMAALERVVAEHPTETIVLWNTLSTTGRAP
jgi:D-cysteine desulfhydrase